MKKILLVVVSLLLAAGAFAQRMTPLTELGTGMYKGFEGGLYPAGSNERPAVHDAAGRVFAGEIMPLNSAGKSDPAAGSIVLLSIGMSNTTQEYSAFINLMNQASYKSQLNPRLALVDGAQGGQDAKIVADSSSQFWKTVDQRIQAAGKTRVQVQTVWLKEAVIQPTEAFPLDAQKLENYLQTICHILRSRFPNLKIVFLSSRIYAGYATSKLNPEPYAYQSGFAVKWLIEKQINGDSAMAYDKPVSPYVAWGPYLWADSLNPRKADGLFWTIDDFVTGDRTHPSPSGQAKVAQQLFRFFSTDSLTRSWFLTPSSSSAAKNVEPNTFVSIYPNPASSTVTVGRVFNPTLARNNLPDGRNTIPSYYDLTVVDALGTIRQTKHTELSAEKNAELDLSALPSGIYFIHIRGEGILTALPISVQK